MNGHLVEGVVPGLLREIYVGRRSGVLSLARGEECQRLRFRRGHIVNADTNVVAGRLGEMLVRRGLLSEADLARATEVVVRQKRRLGEVLAELGLIDAKGLEDAIALHVHETLARVFTWPDGVYSFKEEHEDGPGQELTLKVSTGELILAAVGAVRDPEVVRSLLGDMERVLAPSSDPLLRFQQLTLSPADGFVLSRVDGLTTAREIVEMIPLPEEQAQRSLLALLSTGAVEYAAGRRPRDAAAAAPPVKPAAAAAPTPEPAPVPPPAPVVPEPPPPPAEAPVDEKAAGRRREILEAFEGLKGRNHFEVLGLSRSAGEAEVKDAYFRLAKRFHPDVHHGASLGDLRDELEAVFIRLGEAYEVLRDTRKRSDYEERLGRPRPRPASEAGGPAGAGPEGRASPEPPRDESEEAQRAEESIRRAGKLFEQEKYWDAIQLLEPAAVAARGKARLNARVLLARCLLKNPNWKKRAEEMLLAVTRDEPQAIQAWAVLGALYAEKGMRARATAMYRRALELNPDHEEAKLYLAANATEPEPPENEGGGGLLGRLFGRG
jgi:tetratricopeptide (TPR) repeat protein